MFYFLSERDSATKYHELHTGLATTHRIQQEVIHDLEREKVNYVVLWNDPENNIEPNKSKESSGVKDLDDFIQSHYETVTNFGPYTILKKELL